MPLPLIIIIGTKSENRQEERLVFHAIKGNMRRRRKRGCCCFIADGIWLKPHGQVYGGDSAGNNEAAHPGNHPYQQ